MTAHLPGKAGRPPKDRAIPEAFWRDCRTNWEADPVATFAVAARRAKPYLLPDQKLPAVPTIKKRSDREGWVKKASLRALNAQAHRLADGETNGQANPIASIESRTDVILRHRSQWPMVSGAIQDAIREIETALDRADERFREEKAEQIAKPPSKRKELTGRDFIAYLRCELAAAKTRVEAINLAAQALGTVQQNERRAWALDQDDPEVAQFSDEDRAKLDAMYQAAMAEADQQAEAMRERVKRIREIAGGA
jgi:predicted transcriptional regulator